MFPEAGYNYTFIHENVDLDNDYSVALYELCVYRQFPKMLCFGPLTREYLKKDTDGDYNIMLDDTEVDTMFAMIFKDSNSYHGYSSYDSNLSIPIGSALEAEQIAKHIDHGIYQDGGFFD